MIADRVFRLETLNKINQIRMLDDVGGSAFARVAMDTGILVCQAREHFDFLNTSERWCGAQGRGVLLQEFLEGTEYIVDHVSRDAVHKTTMLWKYDFQEVNGHRVCIAQTPVRVDSSPKMAELVAYVRQCLNALGVRNGATHTEVMWTSGGPCLVEVHTRGSRDPRGKI